MIPKFRTWDKMRNEWSNVYPIVKQERFILMQSTRLKDRNGLDIFESDVISWIDNGILHFGVVEFTKGMFLVNGDEPVSEEMEVIGNIYEHTDLVED